MGFYLKKSISIGGLRLNLSKSGVGMSVGVKGFRIGTSPRGNYVHMGRHGIYYKASLCGGQANPNRSLQESASDQQNLNFVKIETEDVTSLVDASSEELLNEINEKNRKIAFWPIPLIAVFFWPPFGLIAGAAISLLVYFFVDKLRKTTVLMYDIDEITEKKLQVFYNAFNELRDAKAKWNVHAEANTSDYKRNAGASTLVKRIPATISDSCPKNIKCNVEIPCLLLGRHKLYFFPDRVFIYDGNQVGTVSYNDLMVSYQNTRFIESGNVPSDATVVDYTWQYVNKNGTPDKRYSSNRRLPILLYSEINFISNSGLNERIQLSLANVGAKLDNELKALSKNVNFDMEASNNSGIIDVGQNVTA